MAHCLHPLAFWTPGPLELVVILIVAVLLFGRRLPEIARNMGKSMNEFKKGLKEAQETRDEVVDNVRKVGNDVADEARKASGLDEVNENLQ